MPALPASPLPDPPHCVGVRTLCEFVRTGDIDLRFAMSPSAQQGLAGHATVAARRSAGYEREVFLQGEHAGVRVRGRADGYDAPANALEEIKTHRGDLARMPSSQRAVHWAQARIYGWLLCQARGLARIELRLVYFDLGSETETVLSESHDAQALRAGFEQACAAYADWARAEAGHRRRRDAGLAQLRFPHAQFRGEQRRMAIAAFRTARDGGCLSIEAPTGTGKTLGTLFPVLRAMPEAGLDKVFYLTARTTGRALALDALAALAGPVAAPMVRVVELVARSKACVHPGAACTGEQCPRARGFYDRLPAARIEAAQAGWLDKAASERIAARHAVCPYFLAQAMVPWADVVIGDYHHAFDPAAWLAPLAAAEGWRCAVLVDEAHNLVERVRDMHSAHLARASLTAARRAHPALGATWRGLARAWGNLAREATGTYRVLDELPERFVDAHRRAASALAEHLARSDAAADPALLDYYFELLHFLRLAERYGTHSIVELGAPNGARALRITLRNLVPAPFLAPRWAALHCCLLFSGTFGPAHYYADMLGLPAQARRLELASPFRAEQLQVRVPHRLSTRYGDRAASVPPIVGAIARQFADRPGNYLAFFSSYAYLDQVCTQFTLAHPEIPCWRQPPSLDEAGRDAFLARYTPEGQGIGFAVLGGAFGEGIDLPGTRLVGAFIATLGLPQVNPSNEALRARLHTAFGDGYAYAYLYPGLRKVIQAAGRVIRTPADAGVIHLLDERYRQPGVRALLPDWWPTPLSSD
ncbi:ATP-dependent DNA helicase [Verticiella sediminum]|uniref:ATP-dependent DNA helicase n=1 Tax=Verticiella sediminum TaxID=1247510 RepID=A0A556AYK0_9BURK|nr:helicase C-terminal domain-containing protein [Verticiella sediminum]TSH97976.1 ATP-dependent DNA helicase [Verticiella sediminum]